jgi:hypothetical protein
MKKETKTVNTEADDMQLAVSDDERVTQEEGKEDDDESK